MGPEKRETYEWVSEREKAEIQSEQQSALSFYLTICEYAGSLGFDVLRVELTHKKIKLAWLLSNLT